MYPILVGLAGPPARSERAEEKGAVLAVTKNSGRGRSAWVSSNWLAPPVPFSPLFRGRVPLLK